jgi:hypothetical protein
MTDSEIRRLEMFIRVRQYGRTRDTSFPADSRAHELLTEIDAIIAELESHTAAQSAGARASMQGTTLKASARAELREDLEAINHTARAMSHAIPGIEDKFRLPRNSGDQAWLAAARSFATEIVPLKAEFIRRGLPAEFVEDLHADVQAFADAVDAKTQHAGAKVAATAAIDGAVERGMNVVRELDAVVRNVFRNDPSALAEWTSASHTERAARRATPGAHATNAPPAHPTTPAA